MRSDGKALDNCTYVVRVFGICKTDPNAWHFFFYVYCLRHTPNLLVIIDNSAFLSQILLAI